MSKKIILIFVILLSFSVGIFYYQRFLGDFSSEVLEDFLLADNFLEGRGLTASYLPLPGLQSYDRLNLLYRENWPSLSRGPLLGLSIALVSLVFGLSLESSFLFLALFLFVCLGVLGFYFFKRFFPLYLSVIAVILFILNLRLVSAVFNNSEFAINLLFFFLTFYILSKGLVLKNLIWAGAILGLSFYNSGLSLLFFVIFLLYLLLQKRGKKKEGLLVFIVVFFLIISPFLYYRYKLTLNPFYSLRVPLDFVSQTSIYPGEDIEHHLREVFIWTFWKNHPGEVFSKWLALFTGAGLNGLIAAGTNYLLPALAFCGLFYRFRKRGAEQAEQSNRLSEIKSFGILAFFLYVFVLSFLRLEVASVLIFLPFILVLALGFLFAELGGSQKNSKKIFLFFGLLFLVMINLSVFIRKDQGESEKKDWEPDPFVARREDQAGVVSLGPPRTAYAARQKAFALPSMPRQIEDIERDYQLQVYSVYLEKEAVLRSQALRFGGWEKVLSDKRLNDFILIQEFVNGDLYFVRRDL